MKIAQVAPLFEPVPPRHYGGTERVVSWLTEELVAMGHEVTLFASADSCTTARLVPCCEHALRTARVEDEVAPHVLQLERVFEPRHHFDIIHFHTGTMHFPLARRAPVPTVTTMHGRLDLAEARACLWEFRDLPLVSISDQQREPLPWSSWVGTVHHGLPVDALRFSRRGGKALLFLGRMSPEKRPDRAIRIARAAGIPLRMAAKVDARDKRYFDEVVAPLVADGRHDGIEFLGEVDDRTKQALLADSLGLLLPIDWPEPFGIVMIEALAVGTPVVAWRVGSVPSLVEHGRTGFIVDDEDAAVDAVQRLLTIDRGECREVFEERFTARRMAEDYLRIYAELIEASERRIVVSQIDVDGAQPLAVGSAVAIDGDAARPPAQPDPVRDGGGEEARM